jgi:hypothetical protein
MNPRVLKAEQSLVLHVADYAPSDWVRFVSNIELDEDCCNAISFFVVQEGDKLRKVDTGDPVHGSRYHGLLRPIREVWESYGRQWKVADLVVDFTGDYRIHYGYQYRRLAEPINLAGVTILRDYLERFASEIPRR